MSLCSLIKFGKIVSGSLKGEVFIWSISQNLKHSFKKLAFDNAQMVYLLPSFDQSSFYGIDKTEKAIGHFDTAEQDLKNLFKGFKVLDGAHPFVVTRNNEVLYGVHQGPKPRIKVLRVSDESTWSFDTKNGHIQSLFLSKCDSNLLVSTSQDFVVMDCQDPKALKIKRIIKHGMVQGVSSIVGNSSLILACSNNGDLKMYGDWMNHMYLSNQLSIDKYSYLFLDTVNWVLFLGGNKNQIAFSNYHRLVQHWKSKTPTNNPNQPKSQRVLDVETTRDSSGLDRTQENLEVSLKSLKTNLSRVDQRISKAKGEISRLEANRQTRQAKKTGVLSQTSLTVGRLSSIEEDAVRRLTKSNQDLYQTLAQNEEKLNGLIETKNRLWSQQVKFDFNHIKQDDYSQKLKTGQHEYKSLKTDIGRLKDKILEYSEKSRYLKKENKKLKKKVGKTKKKDYVDSGSSLDFF